MSYTVLARRYRSQSFDEVVGQEHVARTLRNAIDQDRTAHAYLFVGTRGVGKTSMARLFAKALNTAGGNQAVERAIMAGEDIDVIEIDGASHGKVEEARELISNATYRPMIGKYKIYIIDEVHMLSTQAFNALLKTMEEPPAHVKFILCTTEANKVPATIQSRCQRFDFRAINTDAIAAHLTSVLGQEGLLATEELVFAVARLGHGSMRDALSILDRLLAALEPGQTLDLELLQRLMGLPERQVMSDLIGAFADNDPAAAMTHSDELLRRGIAIDQLLIALADTLRDLMVLSVCGPGSTLVDASESQREAMTSTAARFDAAALVHMVALVESVGLSMKHAISPRAIFDALMVRMAMTEKLADAAALLSGAPAPARSASRGSPAKKA
jgi:DNA polymerase-3 subunit gamma/tau